jgi:hypothetical protein
MPAYSLEPATVLLWLDLDIALHLHQAHSYLRLHLLASDKRVCPLQWGYRKRKDLHNAWQLQRKSDKLPICFPALRHSSSFIIVAIMQLFNLELACIKCVWHVCADSVLRILANASQDSVNVSFCYIHQLL